MRRDPAWDVFEEHLEEAIFRWNEWEESLDAAHYTWGEVADGTEERLAAHLDALVLGGQPVARRLLWPALEEAEPARVCPAAWVLLAAEDADHLEGVLGHFAGANALLSHALARTFGLSAHPALRPRLAALWTYGEPGLRAIILDVVGTGDGTWAQRHLPEAIGTDDPRLLAASLRLLRRLPDPDPAYRRYVEDALASGVREVRDEAAATGLLLGARNVWEACRREVADPGAGRLPFGLLAHSPSPADRALLLERLDDPVSGPKALWALGFAGDVAAADEIVARMNHQPLAATAGEAFTAITGLQVEGPHALSDLGQGTQADVGSDDPPPEVRADAHLPVPDAEAVARWWRENRAAFRAGHRFVRGKPTDVGALTAALVDGPTWRRGVLALNLALAARGPVTQNLRGWARAPGGASA